MQIHPNTAWQLWQVERSEQLTRAARRQHRRNWLRRNDQKGPRGSYEPRRAPTGTNVLPSAWRRLIAPARRP
jgi:hypothetical protein